MHTKTHHITHSVKVNNTTLCVKKTTPMIILHDSYKYRPIWMKISENVAEGMLILRIWKLFVFSLNILC